MASIIGEVVTDEIVAPIRTIISSTNNIDAFINRNGEITFVGNVVSVIGRNALEGIERNCWRQTQMKRVMH